MPQAKKSENLPPAKTRKPRVSKTIKQTAPVSPIEEPPPCNIHDKGAHWSEVDDICENVCLHDEPLTEFEGKHYCLFHLPTKDKDVEKFEEKFRARLKAVEEKLTVIEALPEDEREKAKIVISYDFRYVWFPSDVNLLNYKFSAGVDFRSATFSAKANFNSATFSATAYFRSATFSVTAYFSEATFSAAAYFSEATFSTAAYFSETTFSADAYFSSATFSVDAYFSSAKFLETSQVFFHQTRFCKIVNFTYSVFAGYVAFEGKRVENVFLDKKAVLEVKKELIEKFENLRKELAEQGIDFQIPDKFEDNQEAVLNLQNARLEKPERISFHRVRLCPSWFVNIDPREMVFTDVGWDNYDAKSDNSNIADEIASLEKREISEPRRLLEIACRQLGVNAEENNRYEDASKFRYMAMETKRLEYGWKGRLWTLSWWYRLSSGYGENWSQAFVVLLGILLLFGVFYNSPFANFEMAEKKQVNAVVTQEIEKSTELKPPEFYKMNNLDGFVHSLFVTALQRPEPKAADTTTRLFVILETIFAPLQAALLALAIRRKFMR